MEKLVQDYAYYLFLKNKKSFDIYFDRMEYIKKANGELEDIEDVIFKFLEQFCFFTSIIYSLMFMRASTIGKKIMAKLTHLLKVH